jgi:transposase
MDAFTLTADAYGELEYLLRRPGRPEQHRAQALLWLAQGLPAAEVAELLGVSRQTVYNWADRYRDRAGSGLLDRLADAPRSGRPPTGKGVIDPLITAVIEQSPQEFGLRSAAWTAPVLCQYLRKEHRIEVSRKTVARAIDRLGLRWKRPRHELALRPDTWRQSKGGLNAASPAARARWC